MHSMLIVVAAVSVMILNGCGNSREQLLQLEELERQNRADSVMRNLELAQSLADHFDRYGSCNEKLRAHYILGRTYADLGEMPQAVDSYLDAIAKADTTTSDCDFHTLGCVYSQMADIFHMQLLLTNEITARKCSKHYAELAGETLNAISSLKLSASAYILLNRRDSAETILREVICLYMNEGIEQEAIQTSLMLMYLYANQPNRLTDLKHLVNQYDIKSNKFDTRHELQGVNRLFYYYKGNYYEYTNQLDSAEHYYRKIAYTNMPFTAKDPMFCGLLSVFKKKGLADSIAKYSQLYCAVNDSSIAIKDQQLTAQMAASYKYNSIQKEAKENAKKTFIANIRSICLLVALLVTITIITVIAIKNKSIRKRMEIRYNMAIVERGKLREELNSLKMKNYDEVISLKEKEIEKLNKTIAKHEEVRLHITANNNLALFEHSDIVRLFSEKKQFKKGDSALTEEDWKLLTTEFSKDLPSAYAVMTSSHLSPLQIQVCILLLLDYEESIIAALKDTLPQTINNAKIRANKKMFMANDSTTLKSNLKRLISI